MATFKLQRLYTRFEPNHDFVSSLEMISHEANRMFPKCPEVGFEVVYRPNSPMSIRAEIHFGYRDQETVSVEIMRDGRIIDSFNKDLLTVNDLKNQLLTEIEILLRQRIPGTKEKLEFIKAQVIGLR